jgi:hypothetical protein
VEHNNKKYLYFCYIKTFLWPCAKLNLTVDTAVHTISERVTVITTGSGKVKSGCRITTVLRTAQHSTAQYSTAQHSTTVQLTV